MHAINPQKRRITLRMLSFFMLSTFSFFMTACGTIFSPTGYDAFECDRSKGNVSDKCKGIIGVIKSTQENLPVTDYDSKFSMEQFYREEGLISDRTDKVDKDKLMQQVLPHSAISRKPPIAEGAPVRIAPVTIKLHINDYVNDSDILVRGHDAYKEVIPAHWSGHAPVAERQVNPTLFFPHFATPVDTAVPVSRLPAPPSNPAEPVNQGQAVSPSEINSMIDIKPQ